MTGRLLRRTRLSQNELEQAYEQALARPPHRSYRVMVLHPPPASGHGILMVREWVTAGAGDRLCPPLHAAMRWTDAYTKTSHGVTVTGISTYFLPAVRSTSACCIIMSLAGTSTWGVLTTCAWRLFRSYTGRDMGWWAATKRAGSQQSPAAAAGRLARDPLRALHTLFALEISPIRSDLFACRLA